MASSAADTPDRVSANGPRRFDQPSPEWLARYVRPCAKSGGRLIC